MAARPEHGGRLSAGVAQGDRARVFFALWPDAPLRAGLARRAREAQAECGGRAVAHSNIHLTLFFVGSIERARLAALAALASAVRASSLELQIDALGYWPHNRIVWAGAQASPAELAGLVKALTAALAREGIRGEARPYAPHITLVRGAARAPVARCAAPLAWRARDFVLLESVAMGSGVRYEVRGRWPLSAQTGGE